MWRFLPPTRCATMVALVLLVSEAAGVAQPASDGPPAPPAVRDQRATDMQRQASDLKELVGQIGQQLAQRKQTGQRAGNEADPEGAALRQQDADLHDELQGLITQLEQELQLEEQSPAAAVAAEQQERQAARDALRREIADLRQQDNDLRGLMTGDKDDAARRDVPKPTAPEAVPEVPRETAGQTAPDAVSQQRAADLRSEIADLQRQDDALQQQLAQHKQELAQRAQQLVDRARELDAARAEADTLRKDIDALRRQRQAEQASLELERLRQGIDAFRQQHPDKEAATTRPRSEERPAPPPAPPAPAAQPIKPMAAPQAAQPMPAHSALQQLRMAQQWLSAGRPDEARRVLAMVQTQTVFQAGTQEGHDPSIANPAAVDISEAIRLLDMGAGGQAMRSMTRAIDEVGPRGVAGPAGLTPDDRQ